MSKEKIDILLKSFSQRPIAYQKIYAQITNSITAGLLLSQIVYWWYAVGEREFYKTDEKFRDELAMGPSEFKRAKSLLKKIKLISTTRKVVNEVRIVRESVWLTLSFISFGVRDVSLPRFSRMRSNTTMVSLSE